MQNVQRRSRSGAGRGRHRGRARRPGLRHRGAACRPDGACARQGRAGELHRRLPGADGVLLDAGPDRDRGPPFPGAGLQADARGGHRVLPWRDGSRAGGRTALRSGAAACTAARAISASRPPAACTAAATSSWRPASSICRTASACPARTFPSSPTTTGSPIPTCSSGSSSSARKNSAAKAALDCYRHGAQVTMVVRGPSLSESVKYWIRPDLENRIKEGSIRAYLRCAPSRRFARRRAVRDPGGTSRLPNDFVLAMTGYQPDFPFLAHSASRSPTMGSGRRSSTR